MTPPPVGVALVGCGFVADLYMQTLPAHRSLALVGVFDRNPQRQTAFCAHHRVFGFATLEALLADPRVALVVNLTNPSSHHAVSRAALEAGKAVYSEKPLAPVLTEAEDLVALAGARGLGLAAAPCTHRSAAARRMAEEIADGRIGRPLLAQAQMDDGMVPTLPYPTWRSASGAPWPAKDEFETGCVLEHAGYQIAPLVALFGPVRRVTTLSALCLPDKAPDLDLGPQGPDLSFGVLEFDGGLLARLTCSILAPIDRSLRVVGETGVLTWTDVWDYDGPLRHSRTGGDRKARIARKLERRLLAPRFPGALLGRRLRTPETRSLRRLVGSGHRMDFARGVAALAASLDNPAALAAQTALALHVTEVALALQDAPGTPQVRKITSRLSADVPPGPEADANQSG